MQLRLESLQEQSSAVESELGEAHALALQQLQKQLQESEQQVTLLRERLEQMSAYSASSEVDSNAMRKELHRLRAELEAAKAVASRASSLEQQLTEARKRCEDLEGQARRHGEEREQALGELEAMRRQAAEDHGDVHSHAAEQAAHWRAECERLSREREQLLVCLLVRVAARFSLQLRPPQQQQESNRLDATREIESMRQQLSAKVQECAIVQSRLEATKGGNEQAASLWKERCEAQSRDLADAREDLATANRDLERARSENAEARSAAAVAEEHAKGAEKLTNTLEQRLSVLERERDDLVQALELTRQQLSTSEKQSAQSGGRSRAQQEAFEATLATLRSTNSMLSEQVRRSGDRVVELEQRIISVRETAAAAEASAEVTARAMKERVAAAEEQGRLHLSRREEVGA